MECFKQFRINRTKSFQFKNRIEIVGVVLVSADLYCNVTVSCCQVQQRATNFFDDLIHYLVEGDDSLPPLDSPATPGSWGNTSTGMVEVFSETEHSSQGCQNKADQSQARYFIGLCISWMIEQLFFGFCCIYSLSKLSVKT